ncbi:Sensor histidine kinase GraS [Eubacterium plexicaudatum ASF492]|uniref:histidine kinase n=1 Tax=Eubacterium plexicaudatum ASF492 TaxID=1235802 RepID=N2A1K4_9FIRM|nr:Sensor histidine kinase GraS [Eubacterium plexicaudatum ASF492]
MSTKQYVKNQIPVVLLHLSGMLALAVFLLVNGNPLQSVLFILFVWLTVSAVYLIFVYRMRKRHLNRLLELTEQLEEKYLIPEVMTVPEQADEQVFYQILKMAEKSMLEQTGKIQRERKEYKEYIEQWIHEVKTPITAMKLLCENNRFSFTKDLLAELEHVNQYTEQALYYARSEHTEKDYCIREVKLTDVIHQAIADNKYLLRQCNMVIQIETEINDVEQSENKQTGLKEDGDRECTVYTDDKWVRFILNQMIGNAVKYRARKPTLHFSVIKTNDAVALAVKDNGTGIPQSDLPRIFEKGFTGQNGRTEKSSTGMGLYLCKRLCDKLGIGLTACSQGRGTTMLLTFRMNDFIIGVRS